MKKEMVLIGKPSSFVVNAAQKGLENADIIVKRADVDVTKISEMKTDEDKVFMLYMVDEDDVKSDLLVYLNDIVMEGVHLHVVGNYTEVDDVKKIIKESNLVSMYERPVEIETLIKGLDRSFDMIEKEMIKKHILVVDDNAVSLRAMKQILSGKYKVSIVNSGVSAITFLTKHEVDLILLDYEMPVVSGPQVLEMIKEEPSIEAPPVMFLTSHNDVDSVKTALALKPVKYLLKSMPSAELMDTLEEYFANGNQ